MRYYHPLLNVPLPSIDDLKTRCVDNESSDLLVAAGQLASYRLNRLAAVTQGYNGYLSEMNLVSMHSRPLTGEADPHLTELDLVRAFMGRQAGLLRECIFYDGLLPAYAMSDRFAEACAHWHSILATNTAEVVTQSISSRWSRRWALWLLEYPDRQIDIKMLLSAVIEKIPPNWCSGYCDGILMASEALLGMKKSFFTQLCLESNLSISSLPTVDRAYFDRHSLLAQADELFDKNCGIVVLSDDDNARRDIVRAIAGNDCYDEKLTNLKLIKGSGGNYFTAWHKERLRSSQSENEPTVYAYLGNIPTGVGGPAWFFNCGDEKIGPLAEATIDFFQQLAELGYRDNIRFVIAMSKDELRELSRVLPSVKNFAVLSIPDMDDRDVVPYYMSFLPEIVDRYNCQVPIGTLLDFLYQTARLNPKLLSMANAREFPFYIKPDNEGLGLLAYSPYKAEDKTPFTLFFTPRRISKNSLQKLLKTSRDFFTKYIGDLTELVAIKHLHETITELNDTQLGEFNLERFGSICDVFDTSQKKSDSKKPLLKVIHNYVHAVKRLPPPTKAQTAQFAAHVASDHSWYKHLPLYPKTPLYFFLDPKAGMRPVHDSNGETRYLTVTDPCGLGGSGMTTKRYRERFGYWNYHMDRGAGPADPIQANPRKKSVFGSELKLLGPNGEHYEIPPCIFYKGRTLVSALVHYNGSMHIWMDSKASLLKQDADDLTLVMGNAPKVLSPSLQFIWAVLNIDDRHSPATARPRTRILTDYQNTLLGENVPALCWYDNNWSHTEAEELGGMAKYPVVLLAAEARRTLESRKQEVDSVQEQHILQQVLPKLLAEEDYNALVAQWENELSDISVNDALDALIRTWRHSAKPAINLAQYAPPLDRSDLEAIDAIVRATLAAGIMNVALHQQQKSDAREIWYGLFPLNQNCLRFVDRYFPQDGASDSLVDQLVVERVQQLENMMCAMDSFSNAIYG